MKINYQLISRNTGMQITGKIIGILLSLVTIGMLTRYLGVEGYGKYTLVIVYLSFFGVFGDLGLQVLMIKELNKNKYITAIYLTIKLFLMLFSIIIPSLLVFIFPYDTELKFIIIFASIGFSLGYFNSFGTVLLQHDLRLDLVAIIELINRIISSLIIIIFVLIKVTLFSMFLSILIGNFMSLLLLFYYLRKKYSFSLSYDFLLAKTLLKKSIPIAAMGLFSLLYFKIDNILLSILKGPQSVGIYGLSYKVIENILMMWGLYMTTVYPLMSKQISNNQTGSFKKLWKFSLKLAFICSALIIIFGYLFSPIIIKLFGGVNFIESIIPFKVLLFSLPFLFINNLYFYIFIIFEETKTQLLIIVSSLILNILLNLMFIPNYGYISTSVNTVITEIFIFLCYFIILNRYKRNLLK